MRRHFRHSQVPLSVLLFGGVLLVSGVARNAVLQGREPVPVSAATSVTVSPSVIQLSGPAETFSILVDGQSAAPKEGDGPEGDGPEGDGPEGDDAAKFDLTHAASFRSLAPDVLAVTERGVVRGLADGQGLVEVEAAGKTRHVRVNVADFDKPRTFHFQNDVLPVVTRFGCNSSTCHAKAEGQNGFKLSVFGYDTEADYDAVVKHARGRRVSLAAPDLSLLLLKAANRVSHGGGLRFETDSAAYATLRGWIEAGAPVGRRDAPVVESVAITPSDRRLRMGGTQQLRVVATYSDGHQVDVTSLAKYQSNNEGLAMVDDFGLVTVDRVPGQVAIMANYQNQVSVFLALIPREGVGDFPDVVENNFIDTLVFAKLRELNIAPSEPASDSDFLRRVYLDVIGTLPTAAEARHFLVDDRPDKRSQLVDEVLRRPEYATYWALKFADLLRVDRDLLGHRGAYEYHRWIRNSLASNKPLDRFAYEILTAEGPAEEAPQGGLFKAIKEPGKRASTVSQVFLGVRIECAQCHHHPFDRWSQKDYYGMADFFTQLETKTSPRGEFLVAAGNLETIHPRTGEAVFAYALGTPMPERAPSGDRRLILAKWLTEADNPWFARNFANRLWAHFMGRGLVEPVDDFRDTNPPSNAELLDALAEHFIASGFDLQDLIRTITNSSVYQLSASPNATNERDEQNYSRALLKPLDAEVLLDAVCQATGIPEKFAGVAGGLRAIELWDSQTHHDFLSLFGRPDRKTSCECERVSEPSVGQVLHLMNSPRIDDKLSHDAGAVSRLEREISDDGELVHALYLSFYSRYATAEEHGVATEHLGSAPQGRRRATVDLAWSLLNSLEFALNH